MRYLLFLAFISCATVKTVPIIVPDSHVLTAIPGEPGWLKISSGYLKELQDDNLNLLRALETCKAKNP